MPADVLTPHGITSVCLVFRPTYLSLERFGNTQILTGIKVEADAPTNGTSNRLSAYLWPCYNTL